MSSRLSEFLTWTPPQLRPPGPVYSRRDRPRYLSLGALGGRPGWQLIRLSRSPLVFLIIKSQTFENFFPVTGPCHSGEGS